MLAFPDRFSGVAGVERQLKPQRRSLSSPSLTRLSRLLAAAELSCMPSPWRRQRSSFRRIRKQDAEVSSKGTQPGLTLALPGLVERLSMEPDATAFWGLEWPSVPCSRQVIEPPLSPCADATASVHSFSTTTGGSTEGSTASSSSPTPRRRRPQQHQPKPPTGSPPSSSRAALQPAVSQVMLFSPDASPKSGWSPLLLQAPTKIAAASRTWAAGERPPPAPPRPPPGSPRGASRPRRCSCCRSCCCRPRSSSICMRGPPVF